MTSLRAKAIIQAIKRGGILNTPISAGNLAQKRKQLRKLDKYFPTPRWAKITAVEQPDFRGEWVDVPQSRQDKILLYLHGGGFVFDLSGLYRDLEARLAQAGQVRVFAPNYSLAPEYPYPAALKEAAAVYKWLLAEGHKPGSIVLGGDSAGGTLALSLLLELKAQRLPLPVATFVMSPATDAKNEGETIVTNADNDIFILADTLRYFTEVYSGDGKRDDPVGSPLYGDWTGIPPLLIHVDKGEILYSDSARLARKAREAGVAVELCETEGLFHVCHVFARYIPEAKQSIAEIGKFIRNNID